MQIDNQYITQWCAWNNLASLKFDASQLSFFFFATLHGNMKNMNNEDILVINPACKYEKYEQRRHMLLAQT